jgi:hypothetical protein
MDAPQSMDMSSSQPRWGGVLPALKELDGPSKLAIVCLVFGWFFMNTLVVTLGSLSHGVRFFDISAVIADPTRLFFDLYTPAHRILFGLLCIACLAAPLTPHWIKDRRAWFTYLAPLALLAVCAVILYSRSSGEFFSTPVDAKSLSGNIVKFANDLVRRGSDLVARHVAVGAGGYLALIGSAVLAVQGVRRFRAAR